MLILSFLERKRPQPAELVKYIRRYANRSRKVRAYKRKFFNLANKIHAYEKERDKIMFTDSFDYQTFEDFIYFLKNKIAYRNATMIAYSQQLNVIIKNAALDGNKVERSFSDYYFKREDSVAVYLTTDEIERINVLTLRTDAAIVRDRFLIGCCTGLRYGDYHTVEIENIKKNTIIVKTKKTGEKVVVPLHWIIKDIINRNHGSFPPHLTSQQNFNKVIKNVCKCAKITEPVIIERTEGFKVIRKKIKKCELVASHTARRSFATNAYLTGIPTAKIMLLTGHRTEQAFFRYIRINKEENAAELENHPFFQK